MRKYYSSLYKRIAFSIRLYKKYRLTSSPVATNYFRSTGEEVIKQAIKTGSKNLYPVSFSAVGSPFELFSASSVHIKTPILIPTMFPFASYVSLAAAFAVLANAFALI